MKPIGMRLNGREVGELIQEKLGLKEDYVQHLMNEDDWTMMILAWGLIEACLNSAITKSLEKPELETFIQNLNINGRSGKVMLAKDLGILEKNEAKFIEKFSSIRNRFAHGINRFRTTFEEYFEEIENSKEFKEALIWKEIPGQQTGGFNFENNKSSIILANVVIICLNMTNK